MNMETVFAAYLSRPFGNIQPALIIRPTSSHRLIALFEITDNNGGSFFLKPGGVRKSKYNHATSSSLLVIIVSYVL